MSEDFKCPYCGTKEDYGNEWGEYGTLARVYTAKETTIRDTKGIFLGRVRRYSHPGTTCGESFCRTEVALVPDMTFSIENRIPKGAIENDF